MSNKRLPGLDEYSETCGKAAKFPKVLYAYHRKLQLIIQLLQEHSGGNSLLDVGSASCDYAADIAAKCGLRVCITDVNQGRLAAAASKNLLLNSVRANAIALPFRNASFSYVLMMNSLRYFESASNAMSEAQRVLKPGGLRIIIDHNYRSPEVILIGRERDRCLTLGALADLVRQAGLTITTWKMLFMLPRGTPAFLMTPVASIGRFLSPIIGTLYAEICIAAVKS